MFSDQKPDKLPVIEPAVDEKPPVLAVKVSGEQKNTLRRAQQYTYNYRNYLYIQLLQLTP